MLAPAGEDKLNTASPRKMLPDGFTASEVQSCQVQFIQGARHLLTASHELSRAGTQYEIRHCQERPAVRLSLLQQQ